MVSADHPLSCYIWGDNCQSFVLADNPQLTVKLEVMPPLAEEELHLHQTAQQFFFILKGEAAVEIEGVITLLYPQQGIEISPMKMHRIVNRSQQQNLEFLLCSQPATANDRFNFT